MTRAECGAVCENAGDYELIEKNKSVYINERGTEKAEKFFNIDDLSEYSNREIKHYIDNVRASSMSMLSPSSTIANSKPRSTLSLMS